MWNHVWEANECRLDDYLIHVRTSHGETLVPWTNEYDYHGVHHRLTIDPQTSFDQLPTITHGTTISFRECNGRNFRYIVDHCVHQDDLNAYLKVICFDTSQRRYTLCSYRPPLILVFPRNHCNVRLHPNLVPKCSSPHRIYTRIEEQMIDGILRGYVAATPRSFMDCILRR
jgi:hypothetical protein